ncbi:MAG: glycosyltransferase family 4 protein [Planctomycetota bacterium]
MRELRARSAHIGSWSNKRILMLGPFGEALAPQQGKLLAPHLVARGARVTLVSDRGRPAVRFAHIVLHALFWVWRYDVVVVQVYSGRAFCYAALSALFARMWGTRVVGFLRGGALPALACKRPVFTAFALRLFDALIAPSPFLQRELGRAVPLKDCQVIPNLIDLAHYAYRPRIPPRPKLLWLRCFHPIYNPLMALDVYRRLRERIPDVSLTFCGISDIELAEVLGTIKQPGYEGVRYLGRIPKEKVPAVIDECDVYLNTNRVDNMPVTVLEMWASGVPVVATDVGGIADLVRDGENGLLVPSEDAQAMSDAVIRLLTDECLTAKIIAGGREYVSRCTFDHICDELARAFFPKTGGRE